MPDSYIQRKYCSRRCKTLWRKNNPSEPFTNGHVCRWCGKRFPITRRQFNKWLCSDECRRKQNSHHVKKFHAARPERERDYRARTKIKIGPDSNIRRFYMWNPSGPRACQSCGEIRVLDIAHKPGFERVGALRSKKNCKWPDMVWVLCPTCHALIDRMNYNPSELNLK